MRPCLLSSTLLVLASGLAGEDAIVVAASPDESTHAATATAGTLVAVEPGEAPMSIEVMTQELLDSRYVTSLYDTFELESGIYTGGRTTMSASSGRPSIRGFGGSEVTLDGLPLPGRMPIFLDAVGFARVEFYKGAITSAQGGQGGQAGMGGSINIVSKLAEPGQDFQHASLGGTFGNGWSARTTYDGNLALGSDAALRLPVAYTCDRPYYLPDDIDANQTVVFAPSAAWAVGEHTTLTASASYQHADLAAYQGIPYLKGSFQVPLDTYYGDGQTRDDYAGITMQAGIEHRLGERLTLRAGAGYARVDEERKSWSVATARSGMTSQQYYDSIIATGRAPFVFYANKATDQNHAAYGRADYDLRAGPMRNQLSLGVDWLKRTTQSWSGTTSPSSTTGLQSIDDPTLPYMQVTWGARSDTRVDRYGALAQDFITWSDWRILLGARVDRHSSDAGNEAVSGSPRLGVTYLIQPECAIYGNYTLTQGPNFGYLDLSGQELTDNWRAEQIEAGVKKRFGEGLWATACLFQITQSNTPEAEPSNSARYYSDGENRSRGAELSLSGELTPAWSWWGSYTNLQYRDVDDGIDFARYPRNSFSLWTAYRLQGGPLEGLRASIAERYASSYCTTFRGAYISDDYMIEEKWVTDIAFEYPLRRLSVLKQATVECGIKNVLDEEYVESNRHGTENFAGLPRTCWVRLSTEL